MATPQHQHREDGGEGEEASGNAELLGGEGEEEEEASGIRGTATRVGVCARLVHFAREDPLLALTLLGVVIGLCFGILLSAVLPGSKDTTGMRETVVKLVSFPGKMFLNLLKMMVLPLISGSMIAGVCSLQAAGANTGKLARVALSYFGGTTLIAVIIGLLVVNIVQPGKGTQMTTEVSEKSESSMLDTMLGVLMKLCPPNIVEAAATMNVLGVLMFSLFFGVVLARLPPEQGAPMIQGIDIFNHVVMGMVMAILVRPPSFPTRALSFPMRW